MAPTSAETKPLMKDDKNKVHSPDSDSELEEPIGNGPYKKKFAFLQVTFRLPIQGGLPGVLDFIALCYGFLPFIVPAALLIMYLCTLPHKIYLYGFAVSITCMIMNELIFKPIVNDPRPTRSANKYKDETTGQWKMKHGMPSGHVLNATVIMVWSLLEVAIKGPGYDAEHIIQTECWFAFIVVLMAPVPWARWRNKDHSLNQCLVAGAIGLVLGVVAYAVRANFIHCQWMPWDEADVQTTVKVTTAAPDSATTSAAEVLTTLSTAAFLGKKASGTP